MKKTSRIFMILTALVCTCATFSMTAARAEEKIISLQTAAQTSAPAETVSITDALPTETPSPQLIQMDGYPKVIDHINFPEEYPDFSFSGEDDLLEIWFPSVRDQDAAIFRYQDQVWMLDCGDERSIEESVPLLRSLGITKIDKLFNTHPHHDHLNGLYNIDKYVPIKELLICFPEDETKHMTAAMEYCKGNGVTITTYGDEDVFLMGDGLVSFLAWQKTDEYESINDRSAQFMISYGSCSMLSMADMENHGQRQLYAALGPEPLKADILRYPHHGKLGMVNEVYLAVDPSLVIITNRYRIAEVRQSSIFLDNKHANVAYTHRNNIILHLTTDGNHWLCEEVVFNAAPWMPEATAPDAEAAVTVSTTTESAEPKED